MKYWIKEHGKWFIVSKEYFDVYKGAKVTCTASYRNTTDSLLDKLYENK